MTTTPTSGAADLPAIISGALFDFAGFLTTLDKSRAVTFSGAHEAGPAVTLLQEWSTKRGLNLDEADVSGWRSALTAQAISAEPALAGYAALPSIVRRIAMVVTYTGDELNEFEYCRAELQAMIHRVANSMEDGPEAEYKWPELERASHGQAPAGTTEPTEQQILEAAEKAGLWPNTVHSWIPAFHRYHKELAKAQPAPAQAAEPVAVVVPCYTPSGKRVALYSAKQDLPIGTKLYAAPQPSPTAQAAESVPAGPKRKDMLWATAKMQERHDQRIENIVSGLERIKQEHAGQKPQKIDECYGDCPTDPTTCTNPCRFDGRAARAPADSVLEDAASAGFFLQLPQRPKPEAPAGTVGLDWDAYSGAQMLAYGRDCSNAAIVATQKPGGA